MNHLEFEYHLADPGEVSLHHVSPGVGFGERPPIVLAHGWLESRTAPGIKVWSSR